MRCQSFVVAASGGTDLGSIRRFSIGRLGLEEKDSRSILASFLLAILILNVSNIGHRRLLGYSASRKQ